MVRRSIEYSFFFRKVALKETLCAPLCCLLTRSVALAQLHGAHFCHPSLPTCWHLTYYPWSALFQIAQKHEFTPTEMALAWCHSRWFMGATIIGATNLCVACVRHHVFVCLGLAVLDLVCACLEGGERAEDCQCMCIGGFTLGRDSCHASW